MTLNNANSRISYAGNGATTVFSFPYYFLADEDLVVIERNTSTLVETVKTLTTHYTVSGEGVEAGGSVTMLAATPTGTTLIIYRDPAVTQGLTIRDNDDFPAASVMQSLDKLTMIDQRLDDRVDRSVRLSEGWPNTFDPTLPSDLVAGTTIMVNDDADGFESGPTASEVSSAQTYATAAASSQSAAATSASAASTSATAAASSASAAATSATNAATSASGASTSASAAATSASGASTSATTATTQASNASTSASGAATSATTATTQASNASTSATNAATSATGAATSATNAANSATAAATSATNAANSAAVVATATSAKSADYTVTTSDGIAVVLMTTAGTDRTITLPAAASSSGRILRIKKVDNGVGKVTIDANASETIDGQLTKVLIQQYEEIEIVCDGTGWHLIGYAGNAYVETLVSSPVSVGTSATWFDATSVSLVAGDWDITATGEINNNGATITTNARMAIGTVSGDTATGHTAGINRLSFGVNSSSTPQGGTVPNYRTVITATTTHYLKMQIAYNSATPSYTCRLSARRLRP